MSRIRVAQTLIAVHTAPFNNHTAFTNWKRELGHQNPLSHIPTIKGKTVSTLRARWKRMGIGKCRGCERVAARSVRAYLLRASGSLVVGYRARNARRPAVGRGRAVATARQPRLHSHPFRWGWCNLCKRDCSARPFASCLTFPPYCSSLLYFQT